MIGNHKSGFGSDPSAVPAPNLVHRLADLRRKDFLDFRRGLRSDGVVILKVLTAIDLPSLQEGLLVGNLRGEGQLVNLTEISKMTDDERRHDVLLGDVKTLLTDPHVFKIVEGMADMVRLGERIFQRLSTEDCVSLDVWHPELKGGFMPSVKLEYPSRYDALTVAFRGEKHPGWTWDLCPDPEILSDEQTRLGYALVSSLVSLSLDGIVYRTYGKDLERSLPSQLGETMANIMQEEVLLDVETQQFEAVKIDDGTGTGGEKSEEGKKLRFKIINGVKIAEPLPGGHCRKVGVGHVHDKTGTVLIPQRRFIYDIFEWEESLDLLVIVPAAPIVVYDPWTFREPKKKCIKPFKIEDIRIYKYTSLQDPDVEDRGRIRFPNLCTKHRVGTSRTASPPPRPDDPNGLREENRRRRQNLRPMGPPCHPGVPEDKDFERDLDWERILPDDEGKSCFNLNNNKAKKRARSHHNEPENKRPKTHQTGVRTDKSNLSTSTRFDQSKEENVLRENFEDRTDTEQRNYEEGGTASRGYQNHRGRQGRRGQGRPYVPRGEEPIIKD